jgi:hypothetical protein
MGRGGARQLKTLRVQSAFQILFSFLLNMNIDVYKKVFFILFKFHKGGGEVTPPILQLPGSSALSGPHLGV